MSKITKLKFSICNSDESIKKQIFSLQFSKTLGGLDIYFTDYSCLIPIHISIHKDGNISVSNNDSSSGGKAPSTKIPFRYTFNNVNGVTPLFFYKPTIFSNYPNYRKKPLEANYNLWNEKDSELNKRFIMCSLVTDPCEKIKLDTPLKFVGTKKSGEAIETEISENPFFGFANHTIYLNQISLLLTNSFGYRFLTFSNPKYINNSNFLSKLQDYFKSTSFPKILTGVVKIQAKENDNFFTIIY